MRSSHRIAGTLLQYDVPNWKPLEALVGLELAGWFMWMHSIRLADGAVVNAYKHIATRRYLHLDGDQRAFVYTQQRDYSEIARDRAILLAFEGWDSVTCVPPEEFEDIRAELWRAIERAGV